MATTPFTYSMQGASGYSGTTGATGAQGAAGVQGATGTGAQGASGYSGINGAQGTNGTVGSNGAQGASGYSGINGAQGTNGTVGSNGAQGAQGATGSGSTGAQGASGYSGLKGSTGAQGAAGTNGAQGASGYSGLKGSTGAQGATGSGSTGAQGAQGTTGANTTVFVQSGSTTGIPTATANGNLWWNTDTGALNIWISSSSSWVVAIPYVDPSTIFKTSGGNITGNVGVSGAVNVTGAITATSSITANYSDIRLKDIKGNIVSALAKVLSLNGISYTANETAQRYGYSAETPEVGLIAQEVQVILPEVIKLAPFDTVTNADGSIYSKSGENYITIQYERIIPLLVEAIKEQQAQIEELKAHIKAKA